MKQRERNREHWGVGEMTLGQRPEASEEEPARQREQPVSARALRWELEQSDWGWGCWEARSGKTMEAPARL